MSFFYTPCHLGCFTFHAIRIGNRMNASAFLDLNHSINHEMREQVHTIFYLLYSRFFYNLVFKFGASPVFPWQLLRIALYNLYCTL